MRRLALFVALFVAANAFAAADMLVTFTPERTQAVTSERVPFRVVVTNRGPHDSGLTTLLVSAPEVPGLVVEMTAVPAGWTCPPVGNCSTQSMPPDTQAEFRGFFITTTYPYPGFRMRASVNAYGGADPVPGNNDQTVAVSVVAASRRANLTLVQPGFLRVNEGAEVQHILDIRNAGPDDAPNVEARISFSGDAVALGLQISGPGWTCTSITAGSFRCTHPLIAAGANAPIIVAFTAPDEEALLGITAGVIAENNFDQDGAGAHVPVYVGLQEDWRMRLVPVSGTGVPGANNALWRADFTMLIRSNTEVEVEPDGCEPGAPQCQGTGQPRLLEPFDPRQVWPASFHGGHFVYVRAEDFEKVRMNVRVYDANRQTQTAGAEIPIPRDDEFTSDVITLLNILVAPQYRYTLRVFDHRGQDGAGAIIRIYANDETMHSNASAVVLRVPQPAQYVTTARLPMHPASFELNLGNVLPQQVADLKSLRVEIFPTDPGVRLWAFVSITNNDTHHVTTVSPQ